MTPLKIMLGGAAIFSLLFTFAVHRIPMPERIEVPRPDDRFQEAWNDVMSVAKAETLKKADRDRVIEYSEPKVIVAERIAPDAPAAVSPVPIAAKPAVKHRRHIHRDVCTRHGKRKVMTRGGRSWRCR